MLIKKEKYEEFIKINNQDSRLTNSIKEKNCDYYIVVDDENNSYSFYLYKDEN